jgi:hypothetical protein
MQKSHYVPWMAMAGVVASLAIAVPVFAATNVAQKGWSGGSGGARGGASGVVGTVSAVNGTTLTVTSKAMARPRANATGTRAAAASAVATVYTVNAASATVYKNGATSTISSVTTGDTVMVQGTVGGTTVTATVIRDGMGSTTGKAGMPSGKEMTHGASSTFPVSAIKGNGEPIVAGNVAAINGTTLTVTNASNVTYTIDAASATIVKDNATSTISNVATGDTVIVQGTVNGNSVTASSILDQGTKGQNASSTGGTSSSASHGGNFVSGIFGAIGGFFSHLFGF